MLAYRAGDADAFEALYRRYRASLYRYMVQQCASTAIAEELYQEVWIKVIRARADYQVLARFSTWLYRIAHHCLIDHFRRHTGPHTVELASYTENGDEMDGDDFLASLPAPADQAPPAVLERQWIAKRIDHALAALPTAQREVFMLCEEGGLTLEEIATATDCGRETVKSRLRYALNKLRPALRDLL